RRLGQLALLVRQVAGRLARGVGVRGLLGGLLAGDLVGQVAQGVGRLARRLRPVLGLRRLLRPVQRLVRLLLLGLALLAAADLLRLRDDALLVRLLLVGRRPVRLRLGLAPRLGRGLRLLLRQAIRAGRLGLLAVPLVGEPLQRPGRLLHALLRLGVGRLL